MLFYRTVSLAQEKSHYPKSDFNPSKKLPEVHTGVNKENKVYELVRQALLQLGLDKEHAGTAAWNPLKDMVKRGDRVVIKPNLVKGSHPYGEKGAQSMITHASVIRPIIDYVLKATNRKCHITICDVPIQHAKWDEILQVSGLGHLQEYYKEQGINIDVLDLRYEISTVNEEGIIVKRSRKKRDPLGYSAVDLKEKSAFFEIAEHAEKLRITGYGQSDGTKPQKHHNRKKNEYLIPNTVLAADLFINVPKLKTHRKSGVTCSMKNLIGINGDKSWIAHHRHGSAKSGGDEFPIFKPVTHLKFRTYEFLQRTKVRQRIASFLIRSITRIRYGNRKNKQQKLIKEGQREILEGSWPGNDTLWRAIVDLSKVITYADKKGVMREKPQRRQLFIVDGIIAGEGEGPMMQQPNNIGVIVAGFNPVLIDCVCARDVMKVKWKSLKFLNNNQLQSAWPIIKGDADCAKVNGKITGRKFKVAHTWKDAL